MTRGIIGYLAFVLAGACTHGATATPSPRTTTTTSAALSPAGDRHPGKITFVDHVHNRTWTEAAADQETSMAWVEVGGRWRPVVRIELDCIDNRCEITKSGVNNEFLEHTAGTTGPDPAPEAPTATPSQK